MAFLCSLDHSKLKQLPVVNSGEVFDDLEGYEAKVMAACELLDKAGLRFRMSGFGLDDWRLDTRYDLSIFVEDLPDILDALTRREEYEFFFSSQGVQRILTFVPAGDSVRIKCSSMTAWVPNPAVEEMVRAELVAMLERLVIDFGIALRRISSSLSAEEPFRSWSEGNVQSVED